MQWRFGISSASTLNALLDKPGVSVEEVLDDADIIQECKAQNQKLIDYLRQPDVLKRLLEHVVGSAQIEDTPGKESEERVGFKYPFVASEVLSSDLPPVSQLLFEHADDLLLPFWETILSPSAQSHLPLPHHAHPITSSSYERLETAHEEDEEDAGVQNTDRPKELLSAQSKGPSYTILAGYWTKVNIMLLEKHAREMLDFVKRVPNMVERLVARFDTPPLVDFLFRLVQCDETVPDANIIEWLSENDLISRTVGLFSPYNAPELHAAAAEFLKAVISLSAPSPSSLDQVSVPDNFGGPGETMMNVGCVNNLLVRELASEENVNKIISFMLDYKNIARTGRTSSLAEDLMGIRASMHTSRPESQLKTLREHTSSDESAVEEDEEDEADETLSMNVRSRRMSRAPTIPASAHRDSVATVRPSMLRRASSVRMPLGPQALNSAFVNCSSVCIELIRKNNSDYFEQHLFHTLRNYLLIRQQEIHEERAREAAESGNENVRNEDDEEEDAECMEEAMASVAEKMGIVHLGPLLRAFCDRLSDLQEMMRQPPPNTSAVATTIGEIEPLTQTRYCIAELYAELLHCSNMALLNREQGSGPQYSPMGTLMGGINGLQTLARVLQGDDGPALPDPAEFSKQKEMSDMGTIDAEVPEKQLGDAEAPDSNIPVIETSTEPEGSVKPEESSEDKPSDSGGLQDKSKGDDDEDSRSIASALSNMSLADLISQFASGPPSSAGEQDERHVDGERLKKQFLDQGVVPLLLELFLKFPWNNFLHNVVYDIIQQLFSGAMDASVNRNLTIATFNDAHLVDVLLDGWRRNQESSKQPARVRLGYMGHLNLIADEVVKLLERYPNVEKQVHDSITQPAWDQFVDEELHTSQNKESQPLAGGRPSAANKWANVESEDRYEGEEGASTFARYLSAQMRNETSDDEEDEEEGAGLAHFGELDRDHGGIEPVNESGEDDWGPFSEPATPSTFEFTSTASGPQPVMSISDAQPENLTPADWAAEFRRGGIPDMPSSAVQDEEDPSLEEIQGDDVHKRQSSSGSSDEGGADDSPFVDLHQPAALRQQTRQGRRSVPDEQQSEPHHWPAAEAAARHRRDSQGGVDAAPAIAVDALPDDVERTETGMLRRKLEDGSSVTVPLDDAELSEAMPSEEEQSRQ